MTQLGLGEGYLLQIHPFGYIYYIYTTRPVRGAFSSSSLVHLKKGGKTGMHSFEFLLNYPLIYYVFSKALFRMPIHSQSSQPMPPNFQTLDHSCSSPHLPHLFTKCVRAYQVFSKSCSFLTTGTLRFPTQLGRTRPHTNPQPQSRRSRRRYI